MCFSAVSVEKARSLRIEKQLKEKKAMPERKVLLLGTGNSGKSTFCKQLTTEYGGTNPHFQSDNEEVVTSLKENVLDGIKRLLTEAAAQSEEKWPSDSLKTQIDLIEGATVSSIDNAVADAIVEAFGDQHVTQVLMARGDHLAIPGGPDGLAYFVKNVKNYVSPGYEHSQEDLLRNRVKTTGIIESSFVCNNIQFTLCDVAGQRNERRKWIHCFSNVSAIVYVTSINEYDTMIEEASHNSLADSLQQFRIISELHCFKGVPFIVFLNKIDLLPKKLKNSPLSKAFSDYDSFIAQRPELKSAGTEEKAVAFFENMYGKHFKGDFCEYHTTCALDKAGCVKVFESIQRSLVQQAFNLGGGLM